MGKKSSGSIIDLFVGLFQIAAGLFGLAVLAIGVIGWLVRLAFSVATGISVATGREDKPSAGGRKSGKVTFEDFHYTGDTKEESFANYLNAIGVPSKPKFKQFSGSGSTYEESQQNFLNALDDWRDKYEVQVYGHRWDDREDAEYLDD